MLKSKETSRKAGSRHSLLQKLPGVDHILELAQKDPYLSETPKSVLIPSIRSAIERLREKILESESAVPQPEVSDSGILETVMRMVSDEMAPNLARTVNATGIIVHTNLGRSLLAAEAIENLMEIAGRYSNLEFDLREGRRGSRYSAVEGILCELCGCEAAMVVNNNAGAVLLCLETIARGKEVIVSRGELVEIGGSFRIPDVMSKSGAVLKEVGTTNRTHTRDYEAAIHSETALLLKVHRSNYSIVGFTAEVSLQEMVSIGKKHEIPVMEDLGSGTLIDFSRYGLQKEPTVQESVGTGADIVTFSGDKLLGGPQSGIIVGRKDIVDRVRKNPLTRALRIDKLTLAALETTLRLYRDEKKAVSAIPTLRMLTLPAGVIEKRAKRLMRLLQKIGSPHLRLHLIQSVSRSGGGALPLLELPTQCIAVAVDGVSANGIEAGMRSHVPPIIGRIENDLFLMDARTVQDDELPIIRHAFESLLTRT
jgi:L-seryl-tRNA(Ser) seleniumtransferase